MTQTYLKGTAAAVHRIDVPCAQTGFADPPCDVHIKFLPSASDGWTLLAHAAPGRPDQLARWLAPHPSVANIRVAPGLAPKLLRAKVAELPASWALVASYVRVHHLDLSPEGHASWFIEGVRDQVLSLVKHLSDSAEGDVHCRPVNPTRAAPITRRQFEALSTAVSLGYYEIPHRLDLRELAARTGLSLGSVSELLRRAEAAILTHYVDANLMGWPSPDEDVPVPFRPVLNVLHR